VKKKRAGWRLCKAKALKLPLKADFISHLSTLQTQHSGAPLSQLAFHLANAKN